MGEFALFSATWWQGWIEDGLLFKFVSAGLAILAALMGYLQNRKNSKYKKKQQELESRIEHLKKDNLRESGHVNPESDRELISKATRSVQLLGINSLGILHHTQEALIEFMVNKHGDVQVLLLDPTTEIFKERVVKEDDQVGRLYSEWDASIRILMAIDRRRKDAGSLELRLRSEKPDRSLAIFDGIGQPDETSCMLINYYPKAFGKRGYSGKQFLAEYSLERDVDSYCANEEEFNRLWYASQVYNLKDALQLNALNLK